MNRTVIVLSSVTYALKAQKILAQNAIPSLIQKLSAEQTQKGCGYGVKIETRSLENALKLLKNERIRVLATLESQ